MTSGILFSLTAAFLFTWGIIGWAFTLVRHVRALKSGLEAQKKELSVLSAKIKKEILPDVLESKLQIQAIRQNQGGQNFAIEDLKTAYLELTELKRDCAPTIVPKNEKPAPQRVQEYLKDKGPSRRIEIMQATKISKTHVAKVLKELTFAGVIEKTEKKTYKLKELV